MCADDVRRELKRAYRTIFSSEHTVSKGLDKLENGEISVSEVRRLVDFVRSSDRGVTT